MTTMEKPELDIHQDQQRVGEKYIVPDQKYQEQTTPRFVRSGDGSWEQHTDSSMAEVSGTD